MAVEAVIGEPVSELGIPCSAGKYREILRFEARRVRGSPALANKFRAFPPNSLRIETGNFASCTGNLTGVTRKQKHLPTGDTR
jgi:hypothetical protein